MHYALSDMSAARREIERRELLLADEEVVTQDVRVPRREGLGRTTRPLSPQEYWRATVRIHLALLAETLLRKFLR